MRTRSARIGILLALATAAQAPLLIWFTALTGGVAGQALLLGGALAALVWQTWRVRAALPCKVDMALVMASLGGLGMLGGWIAGAGGRSMGSEGECPLCASVRAGSVGLEGGSAPEIAGMVGGMLALSIPAAVRWTRCAVRARRSRALWGAVHLAGNAGMLGGMAIVGVAATPLLTRGGMPEPAAAHVAMVVGMVLGMLAAQTVAEYFAMRWSARAREVMRAPLTGTAA
jgi:hypothetical protein